MRGLGQPSGQRSAAWVCAVACALALGVEAHGASDTWGNARILYFEPFATTIDPRPALMQKRTTARLMKFDAYGRRFELALERNEKLESMRGASTSSSVHLYRGQLTNITGSWARIATRGSTVHGLIWDGAQLYVIEPSDAIRDSLVPPLDVANTATVMFRLSDTILDEGAALCASPTTGVTDADSMKGSESYAAMTRELTSLKGSAVLMQSASAGLRLELSAIGDAQFRAQFGSDAEAIDQMLLRLNNVDGIFSAELGVQIQVPTSVVYDSGSDPLPATTAAENLLSSLATLRNNSPQLRSRGLTHLFTGRDLDGATVGIGYINSVCGAQYGVGLTEIRGRGAWLESLITAHEIGHNFGAVHDGEDQCSYVAQNQFLMSPTVYSANATFSSCSRSRMTTRLLSASCITSLPPNDLSMATNLGAVRAGLGRTFEWELPIANIGGRTAQNARVEVLVPSTLKVADAWILGGTCTSGAGVVDCELGDIAGGVTRTLQLTLTGLATGSSPISARIISLSDPQTANNTGAGTIAIDAELDLGITLTASAAPIGAGKAFSASFTVNNPSDEAAQNVTVAFDLPQGVIASDATMSVGSCTVQPEVVCSVPNLAPGASIDGTLSLIAHSAGTGILAAQVSSASIDPNTPNNSAAQTLEVISVTTTSSATSLPTTPSNSGGGGGALGFQLLFALMLLALRRRAFDLKG
jgi:Metallo-peptidase family M12/Domain of unknown function DUF11